ncbi:MAG TPA: hypothetical protein VF457_08705 [Burkholderiaceae bacterium]
MGEIWLRLIAAATPWQFWKRRPLILEAALARGAAARCAGQCRATRR